MFVKQKFIEINKVVKSKLIFRSQRI